MTTTPGTQIDTTQTTMTLDPWSGEWTRTLTAAAWPVSHAEYLAARSESCGCGYDLCGQCMREAHEGLRPPLAHMPTPGAGRAHTQPTAYDLFHRQQAAELRDRWND